MTAEAERKKLTDLLHRQEKEAKAKDRHKKGSKRRAQAKRRLLRLRGLIRTVQNQIAESTRLAKKQGPAAAARWAKEQEGISESPAGSNMGPGITSWERFTGYAPPPGVYWCGCFVCAAVVGKGKAKVPSRIRLGYNEYIVQDAQGNRNGLKEVKKENARKGDIAVMNFPHIVLVTGPPSGGYLPTAEGNTSPDDAGSQFNGGCVALKRRAMSEVRLVARPKYPRS